MSPSLLQIIVLGIVQGAAELLPVSSSAHVIAVEKLMGLKPSSPEMMFLLVMLHAGTMGAMIAFFWKSWRREYLASWPVLRASALRVAIATVATGAVGLGLKFLIEKVILHGRPGAEVEDLFSNLPLIAASLAAAGVVIVIAGLRSRTAVVEGAPPAPLGNAVPPGSALWIGVVQGVCLPFRGLSRSGTTISAGMLLGIPRRASEEFSFALAVVITPYVIFRYLTRLYRYRSLAPGEIHVGSLATPGLIGMACSFAAGLAALRWLSGWLERGRWHYFGFYCFAAAAGVCVLAVMGY